MIEFETYLESKRQQLGARRQPLKVMLELTYGCNLRCVHCYNPTHVAKGEMTTAEAVRVIRELAEAGCLSLGLTGGELFTRQDALEIIDAAQAQGLVVTILTNATQVTPALASALAQRRLYAAEVSMYGASAAVYESVTRVPGSFDRFEAGVDALVSAGVPVLLKPVLLTVNAHEKDAMIAFAAVRGLRHRLCTEIHPRVTGDTSPLAYRLPPEAAFEIWRVASGEGSRAATAARDTLEAGCGDAGALFDCLCGKSGAAVTPYGEMNLCVSIATPGYRLLEGSVAEGWTRLVRMVDEAKAGPGYACGSCDLAPQCTRGTSDSWLETHTFDHGCLSYFRDVAERKAAYLERPKET